MGRISQLKRSYLGLKGGDEHCSVQKYNQNHILHAHKFQREHKGKDRGLGNLYSDRMNKTFMVRKINELYSKLQLSNITVQFYHHVTLKTCVLFF